MKVAAITDDGKMISLHFGRARYYLILTIEEGKIVQQELREKMGHGHSQSQSHTHTIEQPGQQHGMDPSSHDKHIEMADVISDCEALLCGGMGMGAYQSMQVTGIKPVVTDIRDIEQAALAYASGNIVDRVDKLH